MGDTPQSVLNDPAGPKPDQIKIVQHSLSKSIFAEEMVCSIGAQLSLIHQMKQSKCIKKVTSINQKTSYYRLTAKGCIERMALDDWHETTIILCIKSYYSARYFDRIKRGLMLECKRVLPSDSITPIESWIGWLNNAEGHLEEAMVSTQRLIGSRRWMALTSDPI